jgi:hypothetical protein
LSSGGQNEACTGRSINLSNVRVVIGVVLLVDEYCDVGQKNFLDQFEG